MTRTSFSPTLGSGTSPYSRPPKSFSVLVMVHCFIVDGAMMILPYPRFLLAEYQMPNMPCWSSCLSSGKGKRRSTLSSGGSSSTHGEETLLSDQFSCLSSIALALIALVSKLILARELPNQSTVLARPDHPERRWWVQPRRYRGDAIATWCPS